MQRSIGSLVSFAVLVALTAWGVGHLQGGPWLAMLVGASWSPPLWAFFVAWPAYYVAEALAAWLAWPGRGRAAVPALLLWGAQLPVQLAWSWLLLGLHRTGWALAVLAAHLLLAGLVTHRFRALHGVAASLMLACLAWLAIVWLWLLAAWHFSGGGLSSVFG